MDELTFTAGEARLDALLLRPPGARALYVLAHGAGADMRHRFLQAVAEALAEERVATFRYQFPYAQARRRRSAQRSRPGTPQPRTCRSLPGASRWAAA